MLRVLRLIRVFAVNGKKRAASDQGWNWRESRLIARDAENTRIPRQWAKLSRYAQHYLPPICTATQYFVAQISL